MLDGVVVGRTPMSKSVPVGPHEVVVGEFLQRVDVEGGQIATVVVEDFAREGDLAEVSVAALTPYGNPLERATVAVDGLPQGKTDWNGVVAQGSHWFEIDYRGERAGKRVDVSSNRGTSIEIALTTIDLAAPAEQVFPVPSAPSSRAVARGDFIVDAPAYDRKQMGIGLMVGGGLCTVIGFSVQAGTFSSGTRATDRSAYGRLRAANGIGAGIGLIGLGLDALGLVMLLARNPNGGHAVRVTAGSTLGLSVEY